MEENPSSSLEEANRTLEARLQDMERRLAEERERALAAEAKAQGQKALSANVEVALKEAQEKLRRDKREQDLDAARQASEAKVRDLERRLNEERDMWVTMLKEHMSRGGDTQPLLAEISALKSELTAKDEQLSGLKAQTVKGGSDQKALEKEIVALKDMMSKQESLLLSREDELRQMRQSSALRDAGEDRRDEQSSLQATSLQQALAAKEAEVNELLRELDVARRSAGVTAASADMERDRDVFKKRVHEQQEYQKLLVVRITELEKEVGGRDALIQSVRMENDALKKSTAQTTAAKDAETLLLRENLQRLGRQNKELLTKLQSMAEAAPSPFSASGPANPNLQGMLGSLEDAVSNRDRMLEDQAKSIDEKRSLIDDLFGDLRSLDDQAVALLEEKNQQAKEMHERLNSLVGENDRLRRLLEARAGAEPPAP